MPPTPTPTPTRAGGDELIEFTAKEKAALYMFTSGAMLVFNLILLRFIAPFSKGNFVLRELAYFLVFSKIMLIPLNLYYLVINLYYFVVFVYHFRGRIIRA